MKNNSTLKAQAASKANAVKHGETWTSSDLELVEAFRTDAAAELAEALGRTLFSITSIKAAVKAGRGKGRVAASDRAYRGWVEGMGDE